MENLILICFTAVLLVGLGFYSMYGPCEKDSTDALIAIIGFVGMIILSGFWSAVLFDNGDFGPICQFLLFIGEAFLLFWGLFAGIICVMIVWSLFVLIFMKKHAKELFNYERQNKNK